MVLNRSNTLLLHKAQAQEHWLVVAREARLEGPLDLTAADIPLLEHMLVGGCNQGWC